MISYGYAGFWRRLGALLLDSLILWVPQLLLQNATVREVLPVVSTFLTPLQCQFAEFAVISATSALLWWVYSAFFLSSTWQATPGERMLGLNVTDLDGQRITLGRASLRFFFELVSGLLLGLGYLLGGLTARKQTLHDLIAGTLVVRAEAVGAGRDGD